MRFLSACAFLGTRVQARFLGNECNSALCFVWTSASASRAFVVVGRVQVRCVPLLLFVGRVQVRRVPLVLIDGSECVACSCLMIGFCECVVPLILLDECDCVVQCIFCVECQCSVFFA